jgi:hypothetical protein
VRVSVSQNLEALFQLPPLWTGLFFVPRDGTSAEAFNLCGQNRYGTPSWCPEGSMNLTRLSSETVDA